MERGTRWTLLYADSTVTLQSSPLTEYHQGGNGKTFFSQRPCSCGERLGQGES